MVIASPHRPAPPRRRWLASTGAGLAGLAGIGCLFAGPALGGKMQLPLIVVGAALIASEVLWIAQRAADDRADRQTERIVDAQRAAAAAICEAVDSLAPATGRDVADLRDQVARDAALLRRQLADLFAPAVDPQPAQQYPASGPWAPEREPGDAPTAEQPAVVDPPAPDGLPDPVRDALDPGWRWSDSTEQRACPPLPQPRR